MAPHNQLSGVPAGLWEWFLTSIENSTPPIGEPKATATPAALAAVKISRILPSRNEGWVERQIAIGKKTHSDYGKTG